jgi:signal transduction histidine kinase
MIFSDVTEEKRLHLESETRLQQVVQANRLAALGEVVAGVAHEINNPNSFITYNIPLLKETWQVFRPVLEDFAAANPGSLSGHVSFEELMTDMEEIIDAIRIGSERINRVVTNLKDFARLDESTHTRPVNINETVERAFTIVGAQLRKAAESVTLHLAEGLPPIQGHAQKLEQVVANLLVNAAHAIPGKPGGKIALSTRHLERIGSVLVTVEDNGQGMPEAVVDRIFEPFFTTRRTKGGTGLGLSVSYGLVKEHGGTIGVLSRPGRGSRFTVFLPTEPGEVIDLNPTLLCVDDEVAVLKMVRSMLLKIEEQFVETTARSEDVIAFLELHPEVDLVLSDISMPGIDGWDLLERIRAHNPLIAVMLYSGIPKNLEPPPNTTVFPDATLEKPFSKSELIRTITSIGRQRI